MRALLVLVGIAALLLLAALATGFIKLDQTQTAQLPRLEGGQAPKFEADVVDIDVGVRNETVQVPTISVDKPGAVPTETPAAK